MKKLFIFCVLALLFSCEKPGSFGILLGLAWYMKNGIFGSTYQTSMPQTKCGMSTREIELFEQQKVSGETTTWATCQKTVNMF